MAPPPPPPPPPPMPGFLRTFSRPREGGLKRSASSASQATLTSKSNVDKLEFSTDSDSYKVAQISRSNSVTPGLSRGPSRGASSQGPSRAPTPAGAVAIPGPSVWGWGRRWDSMSTLVSDEPAKDLGPEEPPKEKVNTTARLVALRKKMAEEKLDYYIVPSEDAHQSEYVAPADRRREYITGFSGSAGVAIVSQNGAYLFVDSRYWVQAEQEIDNNWILQKVGFEGTRDWQQFLLDRPRNSRIGLDSRMISHEVATTLTASLATRQSRITFPRQNLVDLIWKDRPQRPRSPVMIHTVEFTGKEAKDKMYEIRRFIKSHITPPAPPPVAKAGGHNPPKPPPEPPKPVATLISSLSTIAYTLNLRGSDVPYNPVFLSYLFVGLDRAVLFVELAKISPDVKNYLKDLGISVREYADVWTYLRKREWGEGKILIPAQTPYAVSLLLTSYKYQIVPPFVDNMKAIKNEVEIAGFRKAYMRDGAAMVRWMAWLDNKFRMGFGITEFEAAERLTEFRKETQKFMGLAYENISASGPNAAIPHYSPTRSTARMIDRTTPYLIDSGGQYLDGTCDTTRTLHFGHPTDEQCEAFTRVLKGHIALDQIVFPMGTTGAQLDVLARQALWRDGLNYLHGSGHGVGSFLSVHEGPHSFSNNVPLVSGHVMTNEPGYYKDGEWGLRIESALCVRKVETRGKFGGDIWLGFERFTCVPIQTKMIKSTLMSKEELQWVKNHNNDCLKRLERYIRDDERAMKWIRRELLKPIGAETRSAAGFMIEWH